MKKVPDQAAFVKFVSKRCNVDSIGCPQATSYCRHNAAKITKACGSFSPKAAFREEVADVFGMQWSFRPGGRSMRLAIFFTT